LRSPGRARTPAKTAARRTAAISGSITAAIIGTPAVRCPE
jgi:hypothetical protein